MGACRCLAGGSGIAARHRAPARFGGQRPARRDRRTVTQEIATFEATPFAFQSVQLRRWDDLTKVPGKSTPALGHYLSLLAGLTRPALQGVR